MDRNTLSIFYLTLFVCCAYGNQLEVITNFNREYKMFNNPAHFRFSMNSPKTPERTQTIGQCLWIHHDFGLTIGMWPMFYPSIVR